MPTATKTSLEDFVANPDPLYYDFHELHDGEVVVLPSPSIAHVRMQARLEELLRSLLAPSGAYLVLREFYYTLPGEARRAEIAVVLESRVSAQESSGKSFFGAPDLVVEILSASNSALDLNHIRRVCLRQGAQQFWVMDLAHQTITVYERDASVHTEVALGGSIPLSIFWADARSLELRSLFV